MRKAIRDCMLHSVQEAIKLKYIETSDFVYL